MRALTVKDPCPGGPGGPGGPWTPMLRLVPEPEIPQHIYVHVSPIPLRTELYLEKVETNVVCTQ